MTDRKHIVLLTPGFPADESDDVCMPYLQTYLKEAVKRNEEFKFSVITLQYPYKSKSYLWFGIRVYPCGGRNRPFPFRLYYWQKAVKFLSRIHRDEKIDIVHSLWLSECTYLAQKWTASKGIKHVATAMGQDVLPKNKYLKRINFDSFIIASVSDFQNERLNQTIGRSANCVVPWGIEELTSLQTERNIDVLGVGSLTTLKCYDVFLAVVASVLKDHANIKIVLIGDGPERPNLERFANRLGIAEQVQFLGELKREEVLETMNRSKVLLHTSSFESQGFVFNEAIGCGMSIVSKKVGIAEQSERWVITEKEDEMADGVCALLRYKFEPDTLISAKDTVTEYEKLYG
jgi:1,2-diacylglycerol 3-alpha-glucosyltransferase